MVGLAKRLFGGRRQLSAADLQKAIPVGNPNVEVLTDDESGILLQYPLSKEGKGWQAFVARARNLDVAKKVELDPVGAFVWRLCDGKHTFEGISRRLREEFKMKRVEADAALGAFLQMLSRRKLITLMVKGQK